MRTIPRSSGGHFRTAEGDWSWGLELRSYGVGSAQRSVDGTPAAKVDGQGLAYHWDKTVQEWFVNDGRGLKHGFSVQERPLGPADAPLTFLLATRGPLTTKVTSDARAVAYIDRSGAKALTYSGLRVWDADGRELTARFLPAMGGVELQVVASGASLRGPASEQGQRRFLDEAAEGVHGAGGDGTAFFSMSLFSSSKGMRGSSRNSAPCSS